MQMESWRELANPRDLTRIFQTPEYAAWRAMRADEDTRYIGLCMPHILARLPYGTRTDPQDDWAFEEAADGPDAGNFLWINAAFGLASNITRAFSLYGWCTRIRGVDNGGVVEGLVAHTFASADGDMDRRCITEVSLSERREAELARSGFIPLLHRKNTDYAAFVSAQSLQLPATYADPDATANAVLAARLPYLLASCRFAQYLKCMVRDKVGSTLSRVQLTEWLQSWLLDYIDGSPVHLIRGMEGRASPRGRRTSTLEEKRGRAGPVRSPLHAATALPARGHERGAAPRCPVCPPDAGRRRGACPTPTKADVLMYFVQREGTPPIEAESYLRPSVGNGRPADAAASWKAAISRRKTSQLRDRAGR